MHFTEGYRSKKIQQNPKGLSTKLLELGRPCHFKYVLHDLEDSKIMAVSRSRGKNTRVEFVTEKQEFALAQ